MTFLDLYVYFLLQVQHQSSQVGSTKQQFLSRCDFLVAPVPWTTWPGAAFIPRWQYTQLIWLFISNSWRWRKIYWGCLLTISSCQEFVLYLVFNVKEICLFMLSFWWQPHLMEWIIGQTCQHDTFKENSFWFTTFTFDFDKFMKYDWLIDDFFFCKSMAPSEVWLELCLKVWLVELFIKSTSPSVVAFPARANSTWEHSKETLPELLVLKIPWSENIWIICKGR